MARANPKAVRTPIDPNLPPDHPLEPGFNPRGCLTASPADRIAASEAAARPRQVGLRRCRQQIQFHRRRPPRRQGGRGRADHSRPARRREADASQIAGFAQRKRKLFVGAGVILIAGGALHIATALIDFGDTSSNTEIATVGAEPNRTNRW